MKNLYYGQKVQSATPDETKKQVLEQINSCCSITRLKKFRLLQTSLIEHIDNSRLFFRCESNGSCTKIYISVIDEKFMSLIVNGSFSTVPKYLETEIYEMIQEQCESYIKCLDERIPIIEQKNAKLRKKDSFLLAVLIPIVFFSFLILEHIPDNLNIYGTFSSVDELIMCFPWIMLVILRALSLTAITVIPLRRFIRENF